MASQEQLQGIEQLNEATTEMDRTTQGTVASAQETAHESEELQKQSVRLKRTVDDLGLLIHGFSDDNRSLESQTEAKTVDVLVTSDRRVDISTTPGFSKNVEAKQGNLIEHL